MKGRGHVGLGHASAADLAAAAARRTGRKVRNALARPPSPLDERALLQGFGLDAPSALAERVFSQRPNLIADGRSLAAALERNPGARERAVARAEAVARGELSVFGMRVSFGGRPIDWSFDAGCGRSYPLRPCGDPALLVPGMDPKYPWALGRLEQLLALGQGFVAATEAAARARFAHAFVAQIRAFLQANPVGMGVQWLSPMEVALRAANLAVSLLLFDEAEAVRAPAFLLQVLAALAEHTRFVALRLEDQGAVPNNHLVSNLVGLFVVSALFPELPGAARHAALGVDGLRRQMALQVLEDGYAFEGSVAYHRLSVELFTLAFVVAGRHGFELGPRYAERLRRMYEVSAACTSRRGLAPQIGDNDSGRALPLADRSGLEHGYLATLGAALFAEPRLKREGAPLCDEALWLLGEQGACTFERLAPHPPPSAFSSRQGGLHVLRAGEAFLAVSAGPKGQRGVGGHNHQDQLSFELHLDGVPVIVDPGTGGYTRDPITRNRFRAGPSHNTLSVDGRAQAPLDPKRLFALPDPHPAELTALAQGDGLARVELRSRAFAPATVHRSLLLDARVGALGGVDRFEGTGAHRVTAWLHLPDTQVHLRPPSEAERARARRVPFAPRAFAARALVLGDPASPRAVVLLEEGTHVRLVASTYSPGYGELLEARTVVLEWSLAFPARAAWVVLWGSFVRRQV